MDILYAQIEQAIRQHDNRLNVGNNVTERDICHAIRCVMRDNPDIFWFSYQWRLYENTSVAFHYTLSKEKVEEIMEKIDEVIRDDFQIDYVRTLPDFEKIAYVYKWIVQNCNYNLNSAYNQSIYSVFVLRNSVCTGYAKAAQYLFKLLEIKCYLVFGEIDNDYYHGRHCWNLVEVAGSYFNIDICLGDPILDGLLNRIGIADILKIEGINYNFFCVSTEKILESRSIEDSLNLPIANKSLSYQDIELLAEVQTRHRKEAKGLLLSAKGVTSDIYLCSCDKNVVLKYFRPSQISQCVKEYCFMDRLRACTHLIHIKDEYSCMDDGILALEQSVSVKDIIASPDSAFSLQDALSMVRDIALAVDECYWNNIYYMDIHLNNIYKDNNGIYKLGDFGSCDWAVQTDSLIVKEKVEGSVWFMAPETYNNSVFYLSSATYSLTMLLYFILNDLTPPFWDKYQDERAYEERFKGNAIPMLTYLPFEEDICCDINSFFEKGLAFEEGKRYRGIQEYVARLEELIKSLNKRDYILQFSKIFGGDRFNRTINPCIPNQQKEFDESNIKTEFLTQEGFDENEGFVTAQIECPNCHCHYKIDILQSLAENIRPMLGCNSASGGLSILRKDTDFFNCPNCRYETTVGECMEKNMFTILNNNHRYIQNESSDYCVDRIETSAITINPVSDDKGIIMERNDDFARTCAFSFQNDVAPKKKKKVSFLPRLSNVGEKPVSLWKKWLSWKNGSVNDIVYSSIFAPAEVKRKSHLQVQLYLHLYEESEKVKSLAKESDKNAERRDYIPLSLKLKKGDKVDVEFNVYGETRLMSERKSIIWQGSFTKCSFDYFVPKDIDVEELSCVALLSVNSVPIGEMRFITKVIETPRQLNPEIIAHKYSKVFISYSHLDESKVKFLHEGLELGSVPHFFDRKYLKAGDVFPQVIQDYINSADLFILCWSENASKSEYVQKERLQALERAFPQVQPENAAKLRIYPMNIEPRADLPSDMKEVYNFEVI